MRYLAGLVVGVALLAGPLASSASAARDQVVVSGSVVVAPGQTVGDVVVVDGPVTIAGHATGNVVSIHGQTTIGGTVDGDVLVVSKRARLLPTAHVRGDVQYADKKPTVAPGARVDGKVSHENWRLGTGFAWAVRAAIWLAVSLSTLALGLILRAFAPRAAEAAFTVFRERPGLAAAWAAGLFFGLPIAAVAAMATVFGLPLGIALLLALVPLAAVGYVTSCWLVGRTIARPGWGSVRTYLAGWGALRIVAIVPFLGGLVFLVASAFGLGVLLLAAWYSSDPSRIARGGAPPPAAQPAA